MQFKRSNHAAIQMAAIIAICTGLLFSPSSQAHSPFDNSVRILATDSGLEVSVILGAGAAQTFLNRTGAAQSRLPGPVGVLELPAVAADGLCQLRSADKPLSPSAIRIRGDGLEYAFTISYAAPQAGLLSFEARYFESVPNLANGTLVVTDENGTQLDSGLLSPSSTIVSLTLPRATSSPAPSASVANAAPSTMRSPALINAAVAPRTHASFTSFFRLGVEHILTGYDHLLFLCALLVACKGIRPMLAIITCFTLAHSVTLALAALDLVSISPRVVEPLIAASIVFVGIENFRGRIAVKTRCGITLGFGLVHGFGFAGALRESGLAGSGVELAAPLLAFNLGVEGGQLAVAAVFLPLLFLARKTSSFERYGTAVTSAFVVLLGGFWLVQRLVS